MLPVPQAMVFDMDGTLVRTSLDFAAIRADLGVPAGVGILEAIAAMPPARAAEASRRLLGHEMAAAAGASLMPGAAEVLEASRRAGVKTALLTRNAAAAMRAVMEKFPVLSFDLAWSREDGPIKPAPEGILRACERLGAEPARTVCVGDFAYDVDAALAAGAVAVLLAPGPRPSFADRAHHVIADLRELIGLCLSRPHEGARA